MSNNRRWMTAAVIALSATLAVACDSRAPVDETVTNTETVTLALRGMT